MGDDRPTTAELAGRDEQTARDRAGQEDGQDEQNGREPLLDGSDLDHLRSRWESIQTRFVDEPRRSVEQADTLVAEVMQRLAGSFADERTRLEGQWEREEEVSTEELRVALTRDRSFFDRLLSA